MRISVLLTCHNRRAKTLECVRRLVAQEHVAGEVRAILLDDGCTDGTADAVRAEFPQVRLLHGDGQLYWCGGMRMAFAEAIRENPDYYLWLNDDVLLDPGALESLMETHKLLAVRGQEASIVVGATGDPDTGLPTYGGVVRCSWWHPFKYRLVPPGPEPLPCDTMNGNCVLLPRSVVQKVGNLDPAFTHAMGDFDYGLRARGAGVAVYVAPGTLGSCPTNAPEGTWQDGTLPLRERWRRVRTPTGLPPREWRVLTRRHGGWFWPLFWVLPYVRMTLAPLGIRQSTARAFP